MLEVPYDRFITEPKRFKILEAPYVPNIEMYDFMSTFIPEMMYNIHEELYLLSGTNSFRKYLYNLVSRNNFNNIHIRNLYQLLIDETFRLYQENPDASIDRLIERASDMVVKGYLGLLVKDEPELMRAVDKDIAMSVFKVVNVLGLYKDIYKSNRERLLNGTLEDYTPSRYNLNYPPDPSNFNLYDDSLYCTCWGDLEEKYEESISKPIETKEDYLKRQYLKYSKLIKRLSEEQILNFNEQLVKDAKEYERLYINKFEGDTDMYNQPHQTYRDKILSEEQNAHANKTAGRRSQPANANMNNLNGNQNRQHVNEYGQVVYRNQPMAQQPVQAGMQQQAYYDAYGNLIQPMAQQPVQAGMQQQAYYDAYGNLIQPMVQQPVQAAMQQQAYYDAYGNLIQPMVQQPVQAAMQQQAYYDAFGRPIQNTPTQTVVGRRQHDPFGKSAQGSQFNQSIGNQFQNTANQTAGFNTNMFSNQQQETQVTDVAGRSFTNTKKNYTTINPTAMNELKNVLNAEKARKQQDEAFIKQEVERAQAAAQEEYGNPWNQIHGKTNNPVHKVPNVNNTVQRKDEPLIVKVEDDFDELLRTPADVTLDSDYVPQNYKPTQERKVDRSKHKIKVLNNKIELDTPTRIVEATNTILDLSEEPANPKAKLEGADAKKKDNFIASSVDEFILDSVIQDFSKRNTINDAKTTITSGLIASPILVKPKYKKYLDDIFTAKSFYGIVENITELSESDKLDNDLKMLILQINSRFTVIVNSFLEYNVGGSLYIDDFSEDMLDLLTLIKHEFPKLREPFRQFEKEIIEAFKMSRNNKVFDDLKKELKVPAGIEVGFFNTTATMIITPLVSDELKLSKKFDDIIVSKDNNPDLHSLLTLAAIYEEESGISGLNKFIRTADGLVFNVYLDYENVDKFTLRLHQ